MKYNKSYYLCKNNFIENSWVLKNKVMIKWLLKQFTSENKVKTPKKSYWKIEREAYLETAKMEQSLENNRLRLYIQQRAVEEYHRYLKVKGIKAHIKATGIEGDTYKVHNLYRDMGIGLVVWNPPFSVITIYNTEVFEEKFGKNFNLREEINKEVERLKQENNPTKEK